MSAFEKIEEQYRLHPRELPLEAYVMWYMRNGFVFNRPDFFVMGRAVPRHAPVEQILNQLELFHGQPRDCWYLFAASGNTARMWQVVPWELPWFCWTRITDPLSELQFVATERLKRLCPADLSSLNEE